MCDTQLTVTVHISEIFNYDVCHHRAGLAGLYTALGIDERYSCCILAKETMEISNTWLAQGALPRPSPVTTHRAFTMRIR